MYALYELVCLRIHLSTCLPKACIHKHELIQLRMYVCVYLCMYATYVNLYKCICMRLSLCVCYVCVCIPLCMYTSILYVCPVCVCIHVYVYARVYLCMTV